jgi:hypothetical protein
MVEERINWASCCTENLSVKKENEKGKRCLKLHVES